MRPPALSAAVKKASTAVRDGAEKAICAAPALLLRQYRKYARAKMDRASARLEAGVIPRRFLTDEEVGVVDAKADLGIVLSDVPVI